MTSIHFDNPLLDCLRGELTNGSLDALELSADARNSLVQFGVTTLGHLIDVARAGSLLSLRVAPNTGAEIKHALTILAKSAHPKGQVNWAKYKALRSLNATQTPDLEQLSIAGKIVPLSNSSLRRLSADSRVQGLATLHLSARAIHSLARKGIRSIGDLVDSADKGIAELPGAGRKSVDEIAKSLEALCRSVTREGMVDWVKYATERGFLILPKRNSATLSTRRYVQKLRLLVRTAVKSRFGGKELLVFEDYYLQKRPMVLLKIGHRVCQTRQGASLLKNKALNMLRDAIWSGAYSGCHFRFRGLVTFQLALLEQRLEEAQDGPFLIYGQWEKALKIAWGVAPAELAGLEKLVLALLDYRLVHQSGTKHSPVVVPANLSTRAVFSTMRRARRLLKMEFPGGLSESEIFEKLQHKTRGSAGLRKLIRSIPGLEQSSPRGRLRFRIERLYKMADQLERILRQAGTPMHLRQLTQELGRFPGRKGAKRGPVHVGSAMSADTRFAPVGRSGKWSLTEWNVECRSITEVAHEVLQSAKGPLTEKQMYQLILSKRPLKPSSVGRLLAEDSRFRRIAPRTWELKRVP